MSRQSLRWPSTTLVSLLAALTTWTTLLAWSPFSERSSSYLVPLLAACLVVGASGAVLRSARTPVIVVPLIQLVGLGLWLHHGWVGEYGALGGWLPTTESLREFGSVMAASAEAAQAYAAPVPRDVTATFAPMLVVAGSLTAVLVDLIACGLRRAPVAGLPLLAVYTAPVSILDGGVPWLKFTLAAVLFLMLIASQEAERLSHWGHRVSGNARVYDTQDTRVDRGAIWGSARKIGLTATGLAVVVPLVVPTMSLGLFTGPGTGPGGGGTSVALSNPIVNMRRDLNRGTDVDLVRVRTEDPEPEYLRLTVLDLYDGETWKPSGRDIPVEQRAEGLVPRPPGLDGRVPRETYRWSIDVRDEFQSRWLPAPYPVLSISAPGDWRYDRDTLDFISAADGQTADGLSYDLQRIDLDPTPEQLAFAAPAPAEVFGPGTDLPDSVPDSVRTLARSVTAGERSKFEMAQALQRWFRVEGGFSYSLAPDPGNGVDDLTRFLASGDGGRVGYCEQFASAMALMGRTLGIPSRVAVGFLRGEAAGDNSHVFSAWDLHAWPEMYFEGIGWTPFEPTPGIRTRSAPAYTVQPVDRSQPSVAPSASALVPSGPARFDDAPTATAGGIGSDGGGLNLTIVLTAGIGTLLLLLLLGMPRLLRSWLRDRRWAAAGTAAALAEAAWAELRDTAWDLGVGWDDAVTVRTQARSLVRGFGAPGADADALSRSAKRGPGANPEAQTALELLVGLVERARYSRSLPASAAETAQVRDAVQLCAQALEEGAGRRRQTRATWWPASVWRGLVAGSRRRAADREISLGDPGVDHAI